MEIIKLIPELKARLALVVARYAALELEHKELRIEKENLEALITLYDSKHYDSIDEERRVTGAITKASQCPSYTPRQTTKHNHNGIQEAIKVVLGMAEKPMENEAIRKQVSELLGRELERPPIHNALYHMSKAGKITKLGRGSYKAK